MTNDPRFAIPMEDLRAVALVLPRMRRGELRRMRTIDGILTAYRIDALSANPHTECHHERGVCRLAELVGESFYARQRERLLERGGA